VRHRHLAADGADVDDPALAAAAHLGQHRLDTVGKSHHVRVEVRAQDVGVPGLDRELAPVRGVQDGDVEPA
jgi:hypothetical protein